jgi:hypothetical protein
VKASAETMRPKKGLDIERAISELAVGEALVSFLDAKGRPSETERAYVIPPGRRIGPITPEQRKAQLADSVVAGVYEKTVDRESAYEKIKARATQEPAATSSGGNGPTAASTGSGMGGLGDILFGSTGPRGGRHEGMVEAMAKSAVRTIGSSVGREIVRGVLGGLLGGRR